MKKINQGLTFVLVLLLFFAVGCSSVENPTVSDSSATSTENDVRIDSETSPAPNKTEVSSSPKNDTDVGLKNIKIDTKERDLTEAQKTVLEYFDDDYLSVPSYEFLRRYPNVFEGAQLTVWGSVKKVISMDNSNYKMILWLNVGPVEWEYSYDYPEYEDQYLILTGKTPDTWYMEGDTLKIYGRYTGVETVDVDGTSYTIPSISVYSSYFDTSGVPNDIYRFIPKFNIEFIKNVAKSIFGENIEVRKPIGGIDIAEEQVDLWAEVCGEDAVPCVVVELEDQSNAKFTKFFFYTATDSSVFSGNRIEVGKDAVEYSPIVRSIEFAPDFEHFFMFTYDTDLETLTLEYYDKKLSKIWKREFDETTNAQYDYTKNNIYLVANNELYIINTETGEDTFDPAYVGAKMAIRKLRDGMLMISENKSDGVMKSSLDGSILWKTNLSHDVHSVDGVQLIGNNIVFQQYYWESPEDFGTHYIVLDNETGDIITDALSVQ